MFHAKVLYGAVAVVVAVVVSVESARLLRVPRIYNALITSDEMLIPSQAYPAVAPVLRPTFFYAAPAYPIYNFSYEQDLSSEYSAPRLPDQSLYNLPVQQRVPIISDQVKNNRPSNPDIPDVLPPPLPISRPRDKNDAPPQRRLEDYPPQPSPGL